MRSVQVLSCIHGERQSGLVFTSSYLQPESPLRLSNRLDACICEAVMKPSAWPLTEEHEQCFVLNHRRV